MNGKTRRITTLAGFNLAIGQQSCFERKKWMVRVRWLA